MFDEDVLTKEEFVKAFENVIKQVLEVEKKLTARIDGKTDSAVRALNTLEKEFARVIQQAKADSDSSLAGFKRRTFEAINSIFQKNRVNQKLNSILERHLSKIKEIDNKLKEVDVKMSQVRDGKDVDEEVIVDKVLKKLPEPKEDTPEKIRDKLESLRGEERLDQSAIRGLEEQINELKEQINKLPRMGGGVTDMGVTFSLGRVVKTETPSGAIDGSNKTYTVNHDIHAILSFGINGMVIHDDEYTVSKRTITFNEPLPATLSGKSFTIVYV